MYIRNEAELKELCTSNKSYQEKYEELIAEKEFAERIMTHLNVSIKKLEDGRFMGEMKERQQELLKDLRKNLAFFAGGSVGTGIGFANIDVIRTSLANPELYNKGVAYSLALAVGLALAVSGGIESIKDLADYHLYNHRLDAYQRRLK